MRKRYYFKRELLNFLMLRDNITSDQLASDLGVHYNAISRWRNGEAEPNTFSIKKLADHFKKKMADFVKADNSIETTIKLNNFYTKELLKNG